MKKKKPISKQKWKDYLTPEQRGIHLEERNKRLAEEKEKQKSTGSMIFNLPEGTEDSEEPVIFLAITPEIMNKHLSVMFDAYVTTGELQKAVEARGKIIDPKKCQQEVKIYLERIKPVFIQYALMEFGQQKTEFLQLATDYLYHIIFAVTMAKMHSIPDPPTQEQINEGREKAGLDVNYDLTPDAPEFNDLPMYRMGQRLIDSFATQIRDILDTDKGKPRYFIDAAHFLHKLDKAFTILVKKGKSIETITQSDVAPSLGTSHARQVRTWLSDYGLDWEKCKEEWKNRNTARGG